ncbi:MAG: hypothetical protein GY769_18800 [bacterium]|nr:hypothetical protein [bacterium]
MLPKAPAGVWKRALIVAALAGTAVLFTVSLSAAWSNTADDAYITLRYARHLAEGQGISWNPGEPPVEGYSNFLFVLLGAGLMRVGGATDSMVWLKGMGAAAAAGTFLLAFLIAKRLYPAAGAAMGTAAVVVMVAHPGQAFWGVSGMETTVCQFLIVLSAWALLGAREPASMNRRLVVASLALFAASITRPESPIVLAAFLPFAFAQGTWGHSKRSGRGSAGIRVTPTLLLPFLALYLPYTAWRLWTFGRWLPNSAACKAGYSSDPFYLGREFLEFSWPLLALALAGLALGWRDSRRRRDHIMLLGVPLLYFATFFGVDPVMSHLDRHFLAVLPLVVIAGLLGLAAVAERLLPQAHRGLTGPIVLIVAVLFGTLSAPTVVGDVRRAVRLAHPLEDLRRELGMYLRENLRPGEALAIGDTGLVPFLAGGRVLDIYCLNCREATMPPIDRSPERLADWILSNQPRFIVIQAVNAASERGVWPADRALQEHPALESRYSRTRELGDAGDPLGYIVFERRGGASLELRDLEVAQLDGRNVAHGVPGVPWRNQIDRQARPVDPEVLLIEEQNAAHAAVIGELTEPDAAVVTLVAVRKELEPGGLGIEPVEKLIVGVGAGT